jgi:hypothetical protein
MTPEALEIVRRKSGIGLTSEGEFTYQGSKVANPRVQALFHRGLEVRSNGEVTLTVGKVWAYVSCVGVARFVDGFRLGDNLLHLRFRDGTTSESRRPVFGVGAGDRIYVWPEVGATPAVFSRSAHTQLAGMLESRQEDLGLTLGENWCPLVMLTAQLSPASPAPE